MMCFRESPWLLMRIHHSLLPNSIFHMSWLHLVIIWMERTYFGADHDVVALPLVFLDCHPHDNFRLATSITISVQLNLYVASVQITFLQCQRSWFRSHKPSSYNRMCVLPIIISYSFSLCQNETHHSPHAPQIWDRTLVRVLFPFIIKLKVFKAIWLKC